MQAFYEVMSCDSSSGSTTTPGVVRDFYLAAEEVQWNYAPSEKNLIKNTSLTEEGPVLRAEEGDILRVTFQNKANRSYSIHPHGLHYEKHSQGTSYEDGSDNPGSHVDPGKEFVYTWRVLEGPSSSDSPCIPYLYYSATDPVKDTNSGLVGPLLVCKRGALGEKGIQVEFFLLFSVMDENLSWYLNENIKLFGTAETDEEDENFVESNKMHAINGLMYGNLPGLEMCAGDNVMWYTFGLGTEADIHGVYFEGNTFKKQSTTRDTVSLFPHTTAALFMQPNNHGLFEVDCRTTDHFSAGMRHLYKVKPCKGKRTHAPHSDPTRIVKYYISAEEIEWDYSPTRDWELEKHNTNPEERCVSKAGRLIGSRYKKVVYREYTDETFKTQKAREEHLSILGPIIHGEVGEQILIVFKNKASRPYSITPHGVKASGSHTAVQPGENKENKSLTWDIPVSSGPTISDPNCITYAYFSSVDYIKDLFSGLLGPLVICRPGTLGQLLQNEIPTSLLWYLPQ
uniref:ferroxidase n=1 Tax=Poecilia mexicana TaxID=48701 RepID=A0A3B3WHJ6_9TELE